MSQSSRRFLIFGLIVLLTACSHLAPESRYKVSQSALLKAAEYNIQLGLAYLQKGDRIRAKEKLLRAQAQAPRSQVVQGAMGYFLSQIGEYDQAERYYLNAIALNPKSGAAHNNYGSFLCQRVRHSEAELHFIKATQDPNYLNTASAWENAGLCALQIAQFNKARDYFYKTLAHDPKRATAWLALTQIHYQNSDYLKAQYCLDQYHAINPLASSETVDLKAQLASKLC